MDWSVVILFIAAGLCFSLVRYVNERMKPKKFVKKPDFSWDSLDDQGGSRKREEH